MFDHVWGYPYTGNASYERHPEAIRRAITVKVLTNLAIEFLWPVLRQPSYLFALDIGPGVGSSSYIFSSFRKVIALDVNENSLNSIEPWIGKGIYRVLADGARLPLSDSCCDIIFMNAAFHHISDRIGALFEWSRVLVDGGRVVVAGESPAEDQVDLDRQLANLSNQGIKDEGGYTKEQLNEYLNVAPFKSIKYFRVDTSVEGVCLSNLGTHGWGDNGIFFAEK